MLAAGTRRLAISWQRRTSEPGTVSIPLRHGNVPLVAGRGNRDVLGAAIGGGQRGQGVDIAGDGATIPPPLINVGELIDGAVVVVVVHTIALLAEDNSSNARVGVKRRHIVADDEVALTPELPGVHVAVVDGRSDIALVIHVEDGCPCMLVSLAC